MPANLHEIASQIVGTLRLTEPDLDTSVGTPTRKIIDAVSEAIAEAYIDAHMLTYQYDIDAKIDADLDDFVQLFGMARLAPKRATGVIVFSRSATSASTTTVFIPVHTQVRSNTNPSVLVQTSNSAWMEPGAKSVTVPVQAVIAGPEGNLPANSLVTITSPIQGVSTVTNTQPLSGGTHQETDAELRRRWKTTVFRNLAGTEQMYLGIALDDADCYHANVIGASKKRREQVQVGADNTAATTVDDAAYVFAEPVFVGTAIDAGDILIKGNQYSWSRTLPPRVTIMDSTAAPTGTLLEVDFEYVPKASRNDPANAITNRVDIYVGGQRARGAMQSVVFRTNITFSETANPDPDIVSYVRTDFRRMTGARPATGNFFVPMAFGPILSVPPTISIGGQVYAQASKEHPLGTTEMVGGERVLYAYHVVHDDTAAGYTATSRFGLEWYKGDAPTDWAPQPVHPTHNRVFTIGGQGRGDYTYNAMVRDIQDAIERWRLLGVDAKVHQAKEIELRFSVAIMYNPRTSRPIVDSAIDTAVADWLTSVGFQGRVQVSDILQAIHNVPGVDNVRFLHGGDHATWNSTTPNAFTVGIQEMVDGEVTKSYVDASGRPKDIRLGDSELPVFHSLVRVVKAQNSFGVG